MIPSRSEIIEEVSNELNEREERIRSSLKELQNSLTKETKSTAGDKHETGRAMTHLEQEKLSEQLSTVKNLKAGLSQDQQEVSLDKIVFGSIVVTTNQVFFISIGLGLIKIAEADIFCVSGSAPLSIALIGGQKGDVITFNGRSYDIQTIQ